jgi:hypothetical protein
MHRPAPTWAERYDRGFTDIFALQDEIALSAVGAIAPSLRRAEIDRVKRKRPDSLDAYDLVLRAQLDVDSGMPERVVQALVPLERAIELDPGYALAHGNAAMCHHCLFHRAGLQEANSAASIRHARSAILHGQDDASALTLAGFSSAWTDMTARPRSPRIGSCTRHQAVIRPDLYLGKRRSRMERRSRAGHRVERAGHAAKPI